MERCDNPKPEAIIVAAGANAYLSLLDSLGLLAASSGNGEHRADTRVVLNALHHVLAGGEVSIEVTSAGSKSIVDELEELLANAVAETDELVRRVDPDWVRF